MVDVDWWKSVKTEQIRYYFSKDVDKEEQYTFCKRLYSNNREQGAYVFWFLMGCILGGVTQCKFNKIIN